jgi:hypothetical protein
MQGKIEKIWQNESKQGKPYLTLEIEGERYNVWDEDLFDSLKEGDSIEYEARQSGKYRTIVSVGTPGARAEEEPGRDLPDPNYRSRSIRKMSCLRAASTLTASLDLSEIKDPVDFTVDVARRFEAYVQETESEPGPSATAAAAPEPSAAPGAPKTGGS